MNRVGDAYPSSGALGELHLGVAAGDVIAPVQLNKLDATYIAAQPSNADTTGAAIDSSRAAVAWFRLALANASTPVGKFQILGSVDGTNYHALTLSATDIYGSGFTFSELTPTDISYDGSAAVECMVAVPFPPPYLKAKNDNASGGTTGNRFNASYFLRS